MSGLGRPVVLERDLIAFCGPMISLQWGWTPKIAVGRIANRAHKAEWSGHGRRLRPIDVNLRSDESSN